MEKLRLHINGMVCENSVKQVSHLLENMHGVTRVEVDTLARTTVVEHDERACAVGDVLKAISLAGYQVDRFELALSSNMDAEAIPVGY
ncbi:MAG: heavy-metal-associated domain-containing protein [Phycisphaerales bacterium]|nr:heavy-metal-associated domain-containing protein [Phycisphaerales bacterium]